mmetsp:Transcript_34041/g.93904  ORF Transcript_34041/g.93904 Transcript_34041/m.93904 type:complete len:112 (-) Transcript_34041:14-349(-)
MDIIADIGATETDEGTTMTMEKTRTMMTADTESTEALAAVSTTVAVLVVDTIEENHPAIVITTEIGTGIATGMTVIEAWNEFTKTPSIATMLVVVVEVVAKTLEEETARCG